MDCDSNGGTASSTARLSPAPLGTPANLPRYLRYDLTSGFLVFLIALPLCLAISLASGYPAIAGVFTAIIGGVIGSLISNSELAIKGPAAGLIVIALGCVTDFGYTFGKEPAADLTAYRLALGVGMAAAVVQILFAILRLGALGEFFPTAAVHGTLAAIGVIIISKQIPVMVGLRAVGEPLELLIHTPLTLSNMNPEIALVGFVSLLILFAKPLFKGRLAAMVPSQLLVLLVAIPIGMCFDLAHEHTYTLRGHQFEVGEQHLVSVPFDMYAAITTPDFSRLTHPAAWKWVALYAVIGSLESLLSTKAVDLLDPWRRKTSPDRDLLAVGVGNLCAAGIGGLPMISEIVRSRANVDNGASTRFANMFHGLFVLGCVAFLPGLIHRIPLAALAAMLVYTGFRLAHPREFVHMLHRGKGQLAVYSATMVGILATDLLIGIGIGIAVKLILHLCHGAPIRTLLKPSVEVVEDADGTCRIIPSASAIFTNWLWLRRHLLQAAAAERRNLTLDLSSCTLVDHTVMTKLHELERVFADQGRSLNVVGLDYHRPLSAHPQAARKKSPPGSSSGIDLPTVLASH